MKITNERVNMFISHEVKLSDDLEATYFENFPTVELFDGEGTIYIGSEAWPKLIEVLQIATEHRKKFLEEKKNND